MLSEIDRDLASVDVIDASLWAVSENIYEAELATLKKIDHEDLAGNGLTGYLSGFDSGVWGITPRKKRIERGKKRCESKWAGLALVYFQLL